MTRRLSRVLAVLVVSSCAPAPPVPAASPPLAPAGIERALPQPVVPPLGFQAAVERGTRTPTGEPGPNYWQQWASYRLAATLDAPRRRLAGTGQIVYHNRSPDTLAVLYLHLHQNLHAPGVIRNEPQEVTGGIELRRLAMAGRALSPITGMQPGYQMEGTLLTARPHQPLVPGDSVRIEVEWAFTVPQSGAGRMGWDADNLFFIAYWYPQMAVYDDVVGWHTDPYQGMGEFYMGFADYEVRLDVPHGWIVRATGELRNPREVFPERILERLERAERSDEIVPILRREDLGPGRATRTGPNNRLVWRFTAATVRDFTFSATRESLWDAARSPIGDRTGDGQTDYTRVEALWRETAPRWQHTARYGQHAIRFLSEYLAYPYPWSHMTAVEGGPIILGGMEFPMMTLIGDYNVRGDTALYGVTAHEIGHMWVPMIVGSDEKRYGWLDEGVTNFNTAEAVLDFFGTPFRHANDRNTYLEAVRADLPGEIMRWTDYQISPAAWSANVYAKPSTVFRALRGVLGEEVFLRAYRTFIQEWAYRHPTPWDFFHTFERVSGRNLDWFWQSWYYENWMLDHAVGSVTEGSGGTTIVVEDQGQTPMPVRLTITRADGEVVLREIPVESWLLGLRTASVAVPAGSPVVRVEIDAEGHFPDVDRANNVWTR